MNRGPLALLLALFAALGCGHRHAPGNEVGIWYWHSPFAVSASDLHDLSDIGVSTLYVRAATLPTDGVRVKTMIPQRWLSTANNMPVVLVFNFDAGLDSHFGKLPNSTMAPEIASDIQGESLAAEKKGINVSGVQMDIDCPTRLLPKYAELLGSVRGLLTSLGTLKKGRSFSATALQTWLTSPDGYRRVADACDFLTPQFYEGRVGRTVDSIQPIADIDRLSRGINAADSYGKPFYVGIATYGHALLYARQGRLAEMYHGMGPEDALRHPALQQVTASRAMSEEVLTLRAVKPDVNGHGLGDTIAYVLPTPETLAQQLKAFRDSDAPNCRGIILYRYPSAQDEMALPLSTVAAAMSNRKPAMGVVARASKRSVPWSLIGTSSHAQSAPAAYRVRLTMKGTSLTTASSDAMSVLMQFTGTGLDEADAGDFDICKTGRYEDGQFTPCSPPHANAVYLVRFHALPGDSILSGDITTPADGPKLAEVQWEAKAPRGVMDESGTVAVSDRLGAHNKEVIE